MKKEKKKKKNYWCTLTKQKLDSGNSSVLRLITGKTSWFINLQQILFNDTVTGKKNSWLAGHLWGRLVSQIQITASEFAMAGGVQYFCNLLTWTLHIKGKKYTNMY